MTPGLVFLHPWAAATAAAVALPLLLLLYFLRLRRQMLRMPSTLLWRSATEDLQANVPFQRLRWSLLLLLQLLALAALVAALGRPVVRAGAGAASRMILLIDRSASMSAPGGAPEARVRPTRLDAARASAAEAVRRMGRRSEPASLMVVAFGATPRVVSAFVSSRGLLLDAIAAIEPTDEQADLEAALDLAGVFAGRDESETPPEVVLFSDGGVAPPEPRAGRAPGFSLAAGAFRFVGAAAPGPVDNLGIATFTARRDYEDPVKVLVFARLVNAGPGPLDAPLTLRVDGEPARITRVAVPAATPDGPLGEASFTTSLAIEGDAVLALTCSRRDDLAADNTAALVLRPPLAPRLGLAYAGPTPDPFLSGLLEALEPRRLMTIPATPGEPLPFTAADVDLIVCDGVMPALPADVPSLVFGAAPPEVGVVEAAAGARVLSWDRQHPLLRHVSLDALVFSGFGAYTLPEGWTPLAFGPRGPVIAVRGAGREGRVIVGFRLQQSNWPVDVSVAVFIQNVLDTLARSAGGDAGLDVRPGEPVTVRARPDATSISVQGPVTAELDAVPGGEVTLPALRRVGLYTVRGAASPGDRIAVNLASDVESDLRPRSSLVVNARETAAAAGRDAAPLELWPWLAAAALVLLLAEWIVYCLRARG